ncbi:methylmalonyl-CoA mutase family protein [Nakamurella leprariae]|uniref:Methylmalonyl-CoA mutase n=1 Tax=Nakamurella leprariae TaxID=2803911 RepID=A0A939BY02_9ACTN|nr:methylmalonyl-CoA mutase family protein [Nakamurella leprariae]MBM9469073.1 methylmalonyl-CoA mutase [Nakamurella leprariae]
MEHLELAGEFPPATREQWRTAVAAVLRKSGVPEDKDPEEYLSSRTYDDISIKPLYTADDAPTMSPIDPAVAARLRVATEEVVEAGGEDDITAPGNDGVDAAGWDIRTHYADPDAVRVNERMLSDLAGGAGSVWLTVGAGGTDLGGFDRALQGVYLDLIAIVLDAGADTAAAGRALLELAERRQVAPAELRGSLGADPVATRARTGADVPADLIAQAFALSQGTGLIPVTVDGTVYAEAGGSDADEIAAATAAGVHALRALADAGAEDPFELVDFRFTVNVDQFASIAKLRAARRVWARVAELSGVAPAAQRQHAVTASTALTRRDPWVNMMRTTVATFAAAVGGARAITVTPFDTALGVSDEFARRIARNTQAILHDESSLGRVLDPAGGSWYVESLTDRMAEVAWEKFTRLEQAGGASAALESGALEALLATARVARAKDIARRKAPITGVSAFPPVTETLPERPEAPAPMAGGLLPNLRFAAPFEELQDQVEALAADDARPAVMLLALGDARTAAARVGFATDLFRAGTFEVAVVSDVEAAAAAPVVCLCSSDAVYAEQAADAVTRLRAAGTGQLWLAGKATDELRGLGLDGFVFLGCDVLEVLSSVLDAHRTAGSGVR